MTNEDAPKLNEDFSNIFIISNLPKAEAEKLPKLKSVIMKIFTKKGADYITEDMIDIPMAGEKSAGCAIVKVETTTQARLASEGINGFAMTKKNTLTAATWSEFERIIKIPDNSFSLLKFASLEDLKSYLLNPCSTEYLVQQGQ